MYNLFISHSWKYGDAYEKLVNLLEKASYFSYKNYSVPKDDSLPISGSNYRQKLYEGIYNQMKYATVVLVLAGVYASYSDSINMEIEIAKILGKPIIAIEPWASENTSVIVKENANRIVAWNTSSIVDAIRELGREQQI